MNSSPASSVTWQWVAGILVSLVVLGGSAWMTTMYAEQGKLREEQKKDRVTTGSIQEKVSVIEERTRRTEEDVKEIKETQKEQGRKLDELLRRR